MLKTFRKKGVAKKILWFLAVVIILSFGVFGTANYLGERQGVEYAGKISGRTVSFDDFNESLQHAQIQAMMRYGQDFAKMKDNLNLDSQAWDRLILLSEAKKQKIKVSDQKVVKAIEDMEFFKQGGKFDKETYNRILLYVFRCQPRDFEEGMRESIIFEKLYEKEVGLLRISDEDLLKAYQDINEKTQVSYVLFAQEDYKDKVSLDPKEIEEYFNLHPEDFRIPPAVNFQYIEMKFPENATDEQKTKIEDSMYTISDELSENKNLNKIAQKYKLEVRISEFFSRENPQPKMGWSFELIQKALELKEGELSYPVATTQGYCILRIYKMRDSTIPELKEVSAPVQAALSLVKANQAAKDASEQTLQKIQDQFKNNPQGTFKNIAKELNLKVEQTEPLARGQYIPKIGVSKEFQDAAFSLNAESKLSPVIKTPKGYCILSFEQRIPIDENKFKTEKENFSRILTTLKKNEAFSQFVLQLRVKANLEDNISKLRDLNRKE